MGSCPLLSEQPPVFDLTTFYCYCARRNRFTLIEMVVEEGTSTTIVLGYIRAAQLKKIAIAPPPQEVSKKPNPRSRSLKNQNQCVAVSIT